MNQQNGSAWLVPLADLSLILFIVTGVTLAGAMDRERQHRAEQLPGGFAQASPTAVFIDNTTGPSFAEWLANRSPAPGEQLTIHGSFVPSGRAAIVEHAENLVQLARDAGYEARIVLQPGEVSQVAALFAYDSDPQVAQALLLEGRD